jgi:hypothetical protein
MSDAEQDLAALKARRDMDRLTLMDRVTEARDLAKPGVLVARAKADVEDRARGAAYQALEIANDHRGVVVATASALVLWGMRNHVGSKIAEHFGPGAMRVTRTVLEKAAPMIVAPFAAPWLAPFLGPIAHRLLAPRDPE